MSDLDFETLYKAYLEKYNINASFGDMFTPDNPVEISITSEDPNNIDNHFKEVFTFASRSTPETLSNAYLEYFKSKTSKSNKQSDNNLDSTNNPNPFNKER